MKEQVLQDKTNDEIEIMKFSIQGEYYGIDVKYVKEIMMSAPVKPMPHAKPAVEGFFKPRGEVITVINLACFLTGKKPEIREDARDLFIVTSLSEMLAAFRVDSILGISRISLKSVTKPDKALTGEEKIVTGILQSEDKLVAILDPEEIVSEIELTPPEVSESEKNEDPDAQDSLKEDADEASTEKSVIDRIHAMAEERNREAGDPEPSGKPEGAEKSEVQ